MAQGRDLHPVLRLQRVVGNQAVLGLLRGGVLQRKLAFGAPGDVYEQKAERVAAEVTRTASGPVVQRRCACGGTPGPDGECAACRAKRLGRQHRPANPTGPAVAPPIVGEVLRSPGQPLDAATRASNGIPLHPSAAGAFQTNLAINKPGNEYEQEADRVAQQVMRMPESQRQRACACSGKWQKSQTEQSGQKQEHLQTTHVGSGDLGRTSVPPIVHEVLRSHGQLLDPATRAFMEPRFGHDFGKVRVHTHNRAAESAKAVNALAYTVGDNIVFGAGQYVPGSSRGQSLLAHELTHVVHQNGPQALPGEFAGRPNILHAPTSLMSRLGPASEEEERKKEETQKNEAAKKEAQKRHEEQQRHVADLLDKGRTIRPDPAKGPLDADNLYHNSVQLVDDKRILLAILSPTHDTQTRKPGQLAYFDWHVEHPQTGGDYPADPAIRDTQRGLAFADPLTNAETWMPFATMPGFVKLYTTNDPIPEDDLKRVIVHEAQHVADLGGPKRAEATLDPWQRALEAYQAEFRAFWIQPVPSAVCSQGVCLAQPSVFRLGSPSDPADNQELVTVSRPQDCTICPAPNPSSKPGKSTPAGTKTGLKNRRQENIFWQLISGYSAKQFDCCYVYSPVFRTRVDAFDYPASVNLINSTRLMDLNLKLLDLKPSMKRDEVEKTNFPVALQNLDVLDWAFLEQEAERQDARPPASRPGAGSRGKPLPSPFWEAVNSNAPAFLRDGIKALAKRKPSRGATAADIEKALSGKLIP